MNPVARAALTVALTALAIPVVASIAASCGLLGLTGLWGHPALGWTYYLWGWFLYLPHASRSLPLAASLAISGLGAAIPGLLLAYAIARNRLRSLGGWRGAGQHLGVGRVRRAPSLTHGEADWMTDERMAELFPPTPDPDIGGIVVGERSRDDLTPAHKLVFNPNNPLSLGLQGKGPLMFDHGKRGTTHSFVIGGGGTYKSTTLSTTLVHWKGSAVVQDPAGELATKVGHVLEAQRKQVVLLDLGSEGPNVLDAIDLTTEVGRRLADTRLRSVVARVIGPMPKGDSGNSARFKKWGRAFILALLADMIWREDVPASEKNLSVMRDALMLPDDRLRSILRGIYEHSPSRLAREQASTVMNMPDETWGGAVGNARDDTEWLASYSALVCGSAFKIRDVVKGNLAIFQQIPQEVLQTTPALSRVLIGGLLDAVFAARGKVARRVGFFIDEAVLLENEPALKLARDQGRKFKITLQLFYQSEGQIEDVWGKAQKDAWMDGLSFRSYTRIGNVNTARDLTTTLGTFGARTESTTANHGTSGRPMEWKSRSDGSSASQSEVARELAKPHELLQELRDNERITIVPNQRPMRHLSAIDFLRPEINDLLQQTAYQRTYSEADLENETEDAA